MNESGGAKTPVSGLRRGDHARHRALFHRPAAEPAATGPLGDRDHGGAQPLQGEGAGNPCKVQPWGVPRGQWPRSPVCSGGTAPRCADRGVHLDGPPTSDGPRVPTSLSSAASRARTLLRTRRGTPENDPRRAPRLSRRGQPCLFQRGTHFRLRHRPFESSPSRSHESSGTCHLPRWSTWREPDSSAIHDELENRGITLELARPVIGPRSLRAVGIEEKSGRRIDRSPRWPKPSVMNRPSFPFQLARMGAIRPSSSPMNTNPLSSCSSPPQPCPVVLSPRTRFPPFPQEELAARRQSVSFSRHIAQREQRVGSDHRGYPRLDDQRRKRVDQIVKTMSGVKDSNRQRSASRRSRRCDDRSQAHHRLYKTPIAIPSASNFDTGKTACQGDPREGFAILDGRGRQAGEADRGDREVLSDPKELAKYETTAYAGWDGGWYVNEEICASWKQNRRDSGTPKARGRASRMR